MACSNYGVCDRCGGEATMQLFLRYHVAQLCQPCMAALWQEGGKLNITHLERIEGPVVPSEPHAVSE